MSRLIDADALEKALGAWIRDHWTDAFTGDDAGSEFADIIDHAETIDAKPTTHAGENKDAWISVHDAMPEEKHSIFAKYKGTAKWQKSFWEKQSDIVLVAIACKDGHKFVTTARTVDAVWECDHLAIRGSEVTAWQPMPEPPEE